MLKILIDCLAALKYLHTEMGILHRDIKPQNILIAETEKDESGLNFSAKICDFGVSEKLEAPF